MNAIERFVAADLAARVRATAPAGEVSYVSQGQGGSGDGPGADFARLAADLRAIAPEGRRISAWFSVSSDGLRADGQIMLDGGRGTPMVVWQLDGRPAFLDFHSTRTVRFPSETARLLAVADPETVLEHVQDGGDALTTIAAIGCRAVIPDGGHVGVNFRTLRLEPIHDRT